MFLEVGANQDLVKLIRSERHSHVRRNADPYPIGIRSIPHLEKRLPFVG